MDVSKTCTSRAVKETWLCWMPSSCKNTRGDQVAEIRLRFHNLVSRALLATSHRDDLIFDVATASREDSRLMSIYILDIKRNK
jgi:hypothetical protein